ncbi:hypothetical protein phiOC_p056 [Ochrobactrum phage vB_OspM_OC]|nr:hypothetical protein phiOC_p056 [Ochrobactrum phage vB_OspM_OC]
MSFGVRPPPPPPKTSLNTKPKTHVILHLKKGKVT